MAPGRAGLRTALSLVRIALASTHCLLNWRKLYRILVVVLVPDVEAHHGSRGGAALIHRGEAPDAPLVHAVSLRGPRRRT